MSVKLWAYYPFSPLNSIEDINRYDKRDTDIDGFTLQPDRIIGNGSGFYEKDSGGAGGDIILRFNPGLNLSDFTHMFLWGKTNNTANVYALFQSTAGNYDAYYFINSTKNIDVTNKWKFAKIDLSVTDLTAGSYDNTNMTYFKIQSATPNQDFYINFLCLAYELFEFESNIADVLQGISTSLTATNSNFDILGKNGGVTTNQGTIDEETTMPCFLKGDTAMQKLYELRNIIMNGAPVLVEIEGYGFYPIIIDNISRSEFSKETSESSEKTMLDLTLQFHIYSND
jgi:hypothetical protein